MVIIEEKPSKVLDAKGLLCPLPVIKTSQSIKEVPVGGILEVLATDPGSSPDLKAWANMTGNQIIEIEEEDGAKKVFRFHIRRMK